MQKHIWKQTVRDYELDIQGIVNNATYINYFEQCRNDYARANDIDFIAYHKAGYNLVVAGIEVKYRYPLTAENQFYVTCELSRFDHRRIYFEQAIHLQDNDRLIATAIVTAACVDIKSGRSCMPDVLKDTLNKITKN
jgi:acyl-CoA thioester hydrolase